MRGQSKVTTLAAAVTLWLKALRLIAMHRGSFPLNERKQRETSGERNPESGVGRDGQTAGVEQSSRNAVV